MATRTITLTGRRPVKITDENWPIIAQGTGDSYKSADYSRYQQALNNGEVDQYAIRVRQHADGRTIVYAVFDAASAWTQNESIKGGVLLQAGADLPEAIERVARNCNIPVSVVRECIADLPAEDLVD